MIWMYLKAFLVGGVICAIGQILIDKTRLTPARIVVIYVCTGALLTLLGLYEPCLLYTSICFDGINYRFLSARTLLPYPIAVIYRKGFRFDYSFGIIIS